MAALEPDAYNQANTSINQTTSDLVRQLAQLRQQAAQQQLSYSQNLSGAGNLATQSFNTDVAGLTRDLQGQGVDPTTFNNGIASQQDALAAAQQRQQTYINTLANSYQSGLGADENAALQQQAAAHAALAANYGLAEDAASGGGGGGYGGYGGYGGGGGNDVLSAGDAGLIADLTAQPYNDTPVTSDAQQQVGNKPLDTLLTDYLYGTHGKGDQFLPGNFGHVSFFGNNAASLASKYARYAKAKFGKDYTDQAGNKHKAVDKKTLKAFVKNLKAEQHKVQANHAANHKVKVKQKTKKQQAHLRGLD